MKTVSKFLFLVSLSVMAVSAYAAEDATLKADDQAINTACADDAKTASCGNEVVGKGLLKCLHAYKKANPTFKFSASCKEAMMQRHSDKKAGK